MLIVVNLTLGLLEFFLFVVVVIIGCSSLGTRVRFNLVVSKCGLCKGCLGTYKFDSCGILKKSGDKGFDRYVLLLNFSGW